MMAEHWMKVWPEFYDDVESGIKPFEVRLDDRFPRYEAGDVLHLQEWRNDYTGRECTKIATYVLRDEQFCKDGYCFIGMKDPTPTPEALSNEKEAHNEQD